MKVIGFYTEDEPKDDDRAPVRRAILETHAEGLRRIKLHKMQPGSYSSVAIFICKSGRNLGRVSKLQGAEGRGW